MMICGAEFFSHACDLMEGHPEEMGHICLLPANDLLPDQGSWRDRHTDATFNRVCYRVESDDPVVEWSPYAIKERP